MTYSIQFDGEALRRRARMSLGGEPRFGLFLTVDLGWRVLKGRLTRTRRKQAAASGERAAGRRARLPPHPARPSPSR
ncbi:hypothetical protein RHECNPAF_1260038 [Rhizobium etli CNPAF512]|nr:hypothetical protein RHECNPAF_1260038 [Rhizobium etli CNPAF512]